MFERVKILPGVMAVLAMFLGLKVYGMLTGSEYASLVVSEAIAGAAPANEEKKADKQEHTEDGHGSAEGGNSTGDKQYAGPSADSGVHQPNTPSYSSAAEIDVLNSLADRRVKLDERERDLDLREKMIGAAEKKLDEKITQLKEIEERINSTLKLHDEKEGQRVAKVVKIYENMKPAAAAGIFASMDEEVLLSIVEGMSEKKVSPILAKMNGKDAQRVTEALARRKALPDLTVEKSE